MPRDPLFPFPAIVGQQAFRRALVLNAINPRIGGVLIRGRNGTAKSTAVRSLAALLPPVEVVDGCPYNCANANDQAACPHCGQPRDHFRSPEITQRPVRLVELGLGTSDERLLGTPVSHPDGTHAFQPGLLAAAHQGILYVDDINLLSDHLVDALLGAAASGHNRVERVEVALNHPARFLLVATMNPEEAELRPGLLDRFGLTATTEEQPAAEQRAETVRRRVAYEENPMRFAGRWRDEEAQLQRELLAARTLLPKVEAPERMLDAIATVCATEEVAGVRADLAIYRTASTLAAWAGRRQVEVTDVREAALLALPHRQRREPGGHPHIAPEHVDETLRPFGLGAGPSV